MGVRAQDAGMLAAPFERSTGLDDAWEVAGAWFEEVEDAEVRVGAGKGVVLACGGFECNRQMVQDYLGVPRVAPIGGLYNNGDGVRMGIEVGADLWHMHNYESLGMLGGNAYEVEDGQRCCLFMSSGFGPATQGARLTPEYSPLTLKIHSNPWDGAVLDRPRIRGGHDARTSPFDRVPRQDSVRRPMEAPPACRGCRSLPAHRDDGGDNGVCGGGGRPWGNGRGG